MNKNSNQEPIRTEGTNLGILLSSLLNDDSKEIRLEITCKVVDRGGTEAAAVSERTAKSKEEIPGVPRPLCREGRIDGIAALASFLSCAPSTAQRMKNEGAVPYYQRGVRIFFYEDEVLEALANAPRRSCREKVLSPNRDASPRGSHRAPHSHPAKPVRKNSENRERAKRRPEKNIVLR